MKDMLLGLQLGYWGSGPPADAPELVAEAERLGFDSVWTAEAYGSDALTPSAGSAHGRAGPAGHGPLPAVRSDTHRHGHGRPHPRPPVGRSVRPRSRRVRSSSGGGLVRPVLREAFGPDRRVRRHRPPSPGPRGPVTNDGSHYPLPYPGGTGLGKPLKSIVHPLRKDVPIILGAEGPKNVALAAEIADGWFPIFFSPNAVKAFEPTLAEGFGRPGARHTAEEFEVIAFAPTIVDDDIERAADMMRPSIALYIGGMGAKSMNFHFDVFARMGYEAEASKIQELYLAGHKDEATAAVPTSLIEDTALIGPKEKIRDDLEGWRESIATTLLVAGNSETLQMMAELVL